MRSRTFNLYYTCVRIDYYCLIGDTLILKKYLIWFQVSSLHLKMFVLTLFSDNVYYICKEKDVVKGNKGYSIKYKDDKRYADNVIACNGM